MTHEFERHETHDRYARSCVAMNLQLNVYSLALHLDATLQGCEDDLKAIRGIRVYTACHIAFEEGEGANGTLENGLDSKSVRRPLQERNDATTGVWFLANADGFPKLKKYSARRGGAAFVDLSRFVRTIL